MIEIARAGQPSVLALIGLLACAGTRAESVPIPDADLRQNPDGRAGLVLDGDWHVIADPYENETGERKIAWTVLRDFYREKSGIN